MPTITSRQNAIVSRYRAAARRDDPSTLLLDGPHLVREALHTGARPVEAAVRADATGERDIQLLVDALREARAEIFTVATPVMHALSPVRSAPPIVAIGRRPVHTEQVLYANRSPFVLIAADVQDPGNMGAIVRVAEAAGATGVVAAGACADPFGWKALRGSMGSALRLPVDRVDSAAAAIAEARRRGCRIIATVPRDGRSMYDVDLRGAAAVLIGGEGPGLPESIIESADERLTIPMQRGVESLNAAATAALIVYEARRQRHVSVS